MITSNCGGNQLRFFVYPAAELFERFKTRLAQQFPVYMNAERTITVYPDLRDQSVSRYHRLRDTFLDLSALEDAAQFPPVEPERADYYVVPVIIESNELQPKTFAPNPTPEAALADLITLLPWFNGRAARHLFFFYGDQHTAPRILSGAQLCMVSCHRRSPFHALPYHTEAFTRCERPIEEARLQFVFQGQASVPLRERLASEAPRWTVPNRFTINRRYFELYSPEERARLHREWSDTIADAKFVLCPRGEGLSSIRLFETIASGRIPVIISDDAKLPLESLIDYDSLSVRIPEDRLDLIEGLTAEFEQRHDLGAVSLRWSNISEQYFKAASLRRLLTALVGDIAERAGSCGHCNQS